MRAFLLIKPLSNLSKTNQPQTQAWIQNLTVRQCILFGKPYDRTKYRRTLAAAQLKTDLENLAAGDATEIGERGTFLRGLEWLGFDCTLGFYD